MIQYFIAGGLFMWLLLILLVVNLILIVKKVTDFHEQKYGNPVGVHSILFIGISSAAVGMFGQILGLFEAFKAIMIATDVSPEIVRRGLAVSFHSTIFGFIICFISAIAWFLLYRKAGAVNQKPKIA